MSTRHVYLSPGLFGFSRLGSYDYFCHVEAGIRRRFREAGREAYVHIVDVHPTSSIRRRAARLCEVINRTAGEAGPIHLLGHSTGGVDARLVASPSMNLSSIGRPRPWYDRITSVTGMNAPHYGTPLASFFATVSGQRALAAVSALTVLALQFGAPPLALTSSIIAAFGRIDRALGFELRLWDELTDRVVRLLDDASSDDLRLYMRLLRDDQGAIIQLSPEAMDLFQAGVEDNAAVVYQCTVSYAPAPGVMSWARTILTPWYDLSAPIFATMHRLTCLEHPMYPSTDSMGESEKALFNAYGHQPPPLANDGVVPVRSQVWGQVVWAGFGDHLDVVGHFGPRAGSKERHVDWLCSRSGFDEPRFDALLDAVTKGMLAAEDAKI